MHWSDQHRKQSCQECDRYDRCLNEWDWCDDFWDIWCNQPQTDWTNPSSTAGNPLDFDSQECYESALYYQLFKETTERYPAIPCNETWFHAFANALETTGSPYCASKTLLGDLEDVWCGCEWLSPNVEPNATKDTDGYIRYSNWNRNQDYRRHCNPTMANMNDNVCTDQQFREAIVQQYPGLTDLVRYATPPKEATWSSLRKTPAIEKHIRSCFLDIASYAYYLNDLFDFSIEDSIQNGVLGLLQAVQKKTMREQLLGECRISMIRLSPEIADCLGFVPERNTAVAIERIIRGIETSEDLTHEDFLPQNGHESTKKRGEAEASARRMREYLSQTLKEPITSSSLRYDDSFDIDEQLFQKTAVSLLHNMIESLRIRDRMILKKLYGIHPEKREKPERIAWEFGLSREAIRQIGKKSINKICKSRWFGSLCELTDNSLPPL